MIAKTGFAIASEESRYTLNGALMVLKPESITMVATDGHRLAHIERNGEKFEGVSGELKTLIPKKAMDELRSLLDSTDADTIQFAKDESTLYFRADHGCRLRASYRPASQLRSRPAQGQQQERHAGRQRAERSHLPAWPSLPTSAARRSPAPERARSLSASSTETGESEDSLETSYQGDR
jgi:DNA polymerase-3 subunit beta